MILQSLPIWKMFITPAIYLLIFIVFTLSIFFVIRRNEKAALKPKRVKTFQGKLIRKVIDKNEEKRNINNLYRNKYGMGRIQKGNINTYYITFKTNKGIKSFTVSKRVYDQVKIDQEGTIEIVGRKFKSFKKNAYLD